MNASPAIVKNSGIEPGTMIEINKDSNGYGEQGHVENILALVSHRRAADETLQLCKREQTAGGRQCAEHHFEAERAHYEWFDVSTVFVKF